MKLATTTEDFARFTRNEYEKLDRLHAAGFRYVDLSIYGTSRDASPFQSDNWRELVKGLSEHAARLGMTFVQSHAPGGNPLIQDEKWQPLLDATIRAIEVCGALGIPNTVVHSGAVPGLSTEEYFDRILPFYRLLYPYMEANGVQVLIENSSAACGYHHFLTGAEMRDFLDFADHPLLGACWDTGHANIEGPQYEEILALGSHLKAVHVHDNIGKKDEHTMPFCGVCSMDEVMHALLDTGFAGPFTLESCSTLRPARYWVGNRRAFEKDNRLAEPPMELAQKMEEALFLCGKYILSQYGVFEG